MKTPLKNLAFGLLFIILGTSCNNGNGGYAGRDAADDLDGKYSLKEAKSNIEVDMNFDGKFSKDLFIENPELKFSDLFITNTTHGKEIDLHWMEQNIYLLNQKDTSVSYGIRTITKPIDVNLSEKIITVDTSGTKTGKYYRGTLDNKVKILSDSLLNLHLKRVIYSKGGEKLITIDAVFKKN